MWHYDVTSTELLTADQNDLAESRFWQLHPEQAGERGRDAEIFHFVPCDALPNPVAGSNEDLSLQKFASSGTRGIGPCIASTGVRRCCRLDYVSATLPCLGTADNRERTAL
jgi:hypothetical protein